jgi:hypothetical protein
VEGRGRGRAAGGRGGRRPAARVAARPTARGDGTGSGHFRRGRVGWLAVRGEDAGRGWAGAGTGGVRGARWLPRAGPGWRATSNRMSATTDRSRARLAGSGGLGWGRHSGDDPSPHART